MDKPVVLVLGGTIPHAELIKKLKARGFYTILIDYLDDPPARAVADEHIQESTTDVETVYRIAAERQAAYVMCPCLDIPLKVAAEVSERLGLPFPISYETALDTTLKDRMKRMMVEGGIPTSRYIAVDSPDGVDDTGLTYPLIVKPADNCGSAGITVVRKPENLAGAVAYAIKWSRKGAVIAEEFVEGNDISIYTYVKDGRAHVLLTQMKFDKETPDNPQIRCFSGIMPAPLPKEVEHHLQTIADKIASAFGLVNTPMFFQCIICGDRVSVIELAPRLGGGFCFTTVKENTGFDLLDAAIDRTLGNVVTVSAHYPESYQLIHQIYGRDGIFSGYTGLEETVGTGLVDKWYFHKNIGAAVDGKKPSNARIAAFLSHVKRREDLPELVDKVMSSVDFFDADGRSIMDRRYKLTREDLEGVEE